MMILPRSTDAEQASRPMIHDERHAKVLRKDQTVKYFADEAGSFTRCAINSKTPLDENWPRVHNGLDVALDALSTGGNVGLITGVICLLDFDLNAQAQIKRMGDLANTPWIVRSNAPDRVKLVFRVDDPKLAKSTAYTEDGEKHPRVEWLADGRHAMIAGCYDGGEYELLHSDLPIQSVTFDQIDQVFRTVTGLGIYEKKKKRKPGKKNTDKDKTGYIDQVKNHWPIPKIAEYWGKSDQGYEPADGQNERILANGGLTFDNEKWYCHSQQIGGGPVEFWAFCQDEEFDQSYFMDYIDEMAQAAGIEKPDDKPTSKGKVGGWIDALRSTGHQFRLNVLEDVPEVDGIPIDAIARSKLLLKMADQGVAKTYVDDVINVVASENAYHPIEEYLQSRQWDGLDHLTKFLNHIKSDGRYIEIDGLKVPLYMRLITKWLLGCVARGLDGHKENAFKHQTPMLVLVGAQNLGKSSLIRWLASGIGIEKYHRESALDPHKTDDMRSAVTKWIWEISELGSTIRKVGDREALKGFLTQENHTYRKPWGYGNITKPLLCNFVGTLNKETGFLDDPTGHRRFMPVTITAIDHKYSKVIDINQLWAQLVHMYRTGVRPELGPLEKAALSEVYEEHAAENPLQTYVQMYFEIDSTVGDQKMFTAQIIDRLKKFGVALPPDIKRAGRELNEALAPLGLDNKPISIGGIKGKGYAGIKPKDDIECRREWILR